MGGTCRLNQDRLRKKQGAKDKLRRLMAPLLGITGASGGSLAFKAFSSIRPRISLRFEGIGVTLRDGTAILEGVNGHFRHSKVSFRAAKNSECPGPTFPRAGAYVSDGSSRSPLGQTEVSGMVFRAPSSPAHPDAGSGHPGMGRPRLGWMAQVVAIMGPSGAGKTTLLYALMGTARYGVARGRLCVNGREMRLERLRRILGYVPQVCLRP